MELHFQVLNCLQHFHQPCDVNRLDFIGVVISCKFLLLYFREVYHCIFYKLLKLRWYFWLFFKILCLEFSKVSLIYKYIYIHILAVMPASHFILLVLLWKDTGKGTTFVSSVLWGPCSHYCWHRDDPREARRKSNTIWFCSARLSWRWFKLL